MNPVNPFVLSNPRRAGSFLLAAAAVALSLAVAACSKGGAAAAPAAPQVHVARASAQEVTDWDEFTGRFEAVESVKLRPRVSGYVDSVQFVEGKAVKKGEVLFVIDARPYQVQLDRARAELARADAQSELSERELARAAKLLSARAISQEEYDQRASQRSQLQANVRSARASVDSAQLDLQFTRVVSPIDGRVSRAEVTQGNYVTAGETVLTGVVSLDPIYVYFEGDEQTYLKYADLARRGERPSSRDTANPVFVGLANETDFPHAGRMNFVDNTLNPETGTIRARAVLDNPDHSLTPGMFARVRLVGSGRYTATLVNDAAIGTDQDRRFVMVVNDKNVIEYRAVELGKNFDNQRVVRNGIKPGERVIVGGLQRVRPGMTVAPQEETPAAVAQADAVKNSSTTIRY
jgi:RND family efflux transporter MFP subunit